MLIYTALLYMQLHIIMLGLPLNASNVAVYGETGTYPQ